MENLKIKLENCYGIKALEKNFNFSTDQGRKNRVYAIYAPNGLMKSSFAKTFDVISNGDSPKEARYNRPSSCAIEVDGQKIQKGAIYVLKSEIDINADSSAITDILVNPKSKPRYDELLLDVDNQKAKLINSLQSASKVKSAEIEKTILNDWEETNFLKCIRKINGGPSVNDLSLFKYSTIFDPRVLEILKNDVFLAKAKEFHDRYEELFINSGTIYEKGVFNPTSADKSFSTLDNQGFFKGGHRVHLKGDEVSLDKEALDRKLDAINACINGDKELKKIQEILAKNAQTQAFTQLIENLTSTQVEFLLDKLRPENQKQFRQDLWVYYIHTSSQTQSYLHFAESCEEEITAIEKAAAEIVTCLGILKPR